MWSRIFCCGLSLVLLYGRSDRILAAPTSVLWLHVSDTKGKPVVGVQISTLGPGGTSAPTDNGGKTRLTLAAGTKPGDWISLQVLSSQKTWIFISPWNARLRVPAARSGAEDFESIILGQPGSRELLSNPEAIRTIVSLILKETAPKFTQPEVTSAEERLKLALIEVSNHFGLHPGEVDEAIRTWITTAKDPFEKGLADLYSKKYPQATETLNQSFKLRKRRLAEARTEAVEAAQFLGQALYAEGKYEQAAQTYTEALDLGGDDIYLLQGLSLSQYAAGRYGEAEQAAQKAFDMAQKTLGPRDPLIYTCEANLAAVLDRRGYWSKARHLLEDALAGLQSSLGESYPGALTVRHNLATCLFNQGDLAGARRMLEELLPVQARLMGADNIETLSTKNTYAEVIGTQGELAQARRLQEEVLSSLEPQLGDNHPLVLLVKNNLAGKLLEQGDAGGAHRLLNEVIGTYERLLGKKHPDTLISKANLAEVLFIQGEISDSLNLSREVLSGFEQAFGTNHPFSINMKAHLAEKLFLKGDYAGARKLQEEVLSAREQLLGEHDTMTTVAATNLLVTLLKLRDLSATRSVLDKLKWLLEAPDGSLSNQQQEMRLALRSLMDRSKMISPEPQPRPNYVPP